MNITAFFIFVNVEMKIFLSRQYISFMQRLYSTQLIATDGGSLRNGKHDCRCAYSIFFGDNDQRNESGEIFKNPSNQTAELTAITKAIAIISDQKENHTVGDRYVILSDSDYSIKCITQWAPKWIRSNWKKSDGKPVHHRYLLEDAVQQYAMIKDYVTFKHIRSHKRPPTNRTSEAYLEWYSNDQADRMCTNILKMRKSIGTE